MPAISPAGLLGVLVVCAWPVSGQYGPGSRVLYYVLVAACVWARKAEWLRKACLAAALLFPAVAAIHGIVLASVHVNGAVDMDVYGAFQLCSIGILAAPLTVKLSRTYFNDPGRNTIFLWTVLVLAGLLSLTVEFYRVTTHDCTQDNLGRPIPKGASKFPYDNVTCNLTCSIAAGPKSPMRRGANNEIYIIPAPTKFTFDAAMLLGAACCIPAILSLIFTFDKILEINWKTRNGRVDEATLMEQVIDGTNGATEGRMKGVNSIVRRFLSVIEIPVFAGAVLAILVIGEANFFSYQVRYETEPMASIGQWSPIAGTFLAALGSLYVLLTGKGSRAESAVHCSCQHHDHGLDRQPTINYPSDDDHSHHSRSLDGDDSFELRASNELGITISRPEPSVLDRTKTMSTFRDFGNRRRVARFMHQAGNYLGAAAHDRLDLSQYNRGRARGYPEIPGERHRNADLERTRSHFRERREAVMRNQRSRVGSSGVSIASASGVTTVVDNGNEADIEGGAEKSTTERREGTPPRTSSRSPQRIQRRRDTLEVPTPTYGSPRLT